MTNVSIDLSKIDTDFKAPEIKDKDNLTETDMLEYQKQLMQYSTKINFATNVMGAVKDMLRGIVSNLK